MTSAPRDDLNFRSDNAAGVCDEIMAALATANQGSAGAYGDDDWSRQLDAAFGALFGVAVAVFPVSTGTAANALALSALTPPWGAVYCHHGAHIEEDECGAPGFFTGGAKLLPLDGAHGKIDAEGLAEAVGRAGFGVQHQVQPAAVSLTQASESGTVYRPDEVAAIAEVCHAHGLALHMDGARFANAVAHLGCHPAEVTVRAGVDVLCFGATKNGALAAEAVVFFRPDHARDFLYRRKRAGHLVSKQRFISAQLLACLRDDLWLRNAAHANAMAARLGAGLAGLPGARLENPVEANEVFATLPVAALSRLEAAGAGFYRWGQGAHGAAGAGGDAATVRLVTAFDTAPAAVDRLIALARGA